MPTQHTGVQLILFWSFYLLCPLAYNATHRHVAYSIVVQVKEHTYEFVPIFLSKANRTHTNFSREARKTDEIKDVEGKKLASYFRGNVRA